MAISLFSYTKSADKYGLIETPQVQQLQNEPGTLGNLGRAAGSGALSAVGGIFDFVGAEGVAKQFYGWSDDARQSMSTEAQQDMAKPFFDENEQGDIQLGEGFTDLDTWLLTMANVVGQAAPTMIPGAGIGSAATKALSLGKTGAKVAGAAGMGATGGAAATGQGMEQARQEYLAMPDEVKAQSDLFKSTLKRINSEQPGLDPDSLWNATDEVIAAQLADDVRKDPATLLANFAGSAIADPIIGKALTGARLAKSGAFRSALKGFAIEGATEAGQAGVQEYGINKALAQVDERDPTEGVALAALNEGVAGGAFGGAAGLAGGFANRNSEPAPVTDPEADAIRDSNPVLASALDASAQSASQRNNDLSDILQAATEQPINYDIPAAARKAGAKNDIEAGKFGDRLLNPTIEGELLTAESARQMQEFSANQPLALPDKNIIFAEDGRPLQAAKEFAANAMNAARPAIPQKDVIFAADQSGITVKLSGQPFQSKTEALASKQARLMKKSGKVEAVPFGDGWGVRLQTLKEVTPGELSEGHDSSQPTSFKPTPTRLEDGAEVDHTLADAESSVQVVADIPAQDVTEGFEFEADGKTVKVYGEPSQIKTKLKAAGISLSGADIDGGLSFGVKYEPQIREALQEQPQQQQVATEPELAPIQMKKSGEPFKAEKEMKMSASYKAALASGAELETVKTEGGYGFRAISKAPEIETVKPAAIPAAKKNTAKELPKAVQRSTGIIGAKAGDTIRIKGTIGYAGDGDYYIEQINNDGTVFISDGQGTTNLTVSDLVAAKTRGEVTFTKLGSEVAEVAQTEQSNGSLATSAVASQPENIDTGLGTSDSVTLPSVEAIQSLNKDAATDNSEAILPDILRMTKKRYIAQLAKQQKLKDTSPGYVQAVAQLEEQYESDVDQAQASLTFEQFNSLNDDSPESVNRQAYKVLREEFGLPVDLNFSKARTNQKNESPAPDEQVNLDSFQEVSGAAENTEQVRLIRSQLPSSGSLTPVSDANVQEASDVDNQEFKFSKTSNKPDADAYRSALEKSLKSLRSNPEPIRMGKTPDVMVRFGAPELDLYVRKDTIQKATNKIKENHDVPMSVIEQLPELLADPIVVLDDSGKEPAQVLIVDAVTESGKPVAVAVHMAVSEGRLVVNRIASAYAKDNLKRMTLLYLNENKNPALVRLIRPQLPLSGSPSRGSEQNVLTKDDLVKENPDIKFQAANSDTKKPTKSISAEQARRVVSSIVKQLNGAAGIKMVVLDNQKQAEKQWQMSLEGSTVRGAYDDKTKTAYVIAENIESVDQLREVVAHEVLAHGGLDTVIGKDKYKQFIDRLQQTRSNREFKKLWAQIDRDYDGFSENDKAEELFAYYAQNKPVSGPLKFWWNALKRWLHKALASVGLAKAGDPDIDAMDAMIESIRVGFMGDRVSDAKAKPATGSERSELAFNRTANADTRTAKEKLGLEDQVRETIAQQAKARTKATIDTLKSSPFWQRMNEGIFDGMSGIKLAEESVGVTDPNQQGYVSARLASGLADVLHAVFNYGAPEWRDGVVSRKADTKGMLEVFGMLGDDLNNWLAWMGANRAEKLMAEGRENNLTSADIAELKALANGKEQLFEDVRQEYNKINSAVITLAQEAGLISPEQRGGFDEEWYVPFFRDMDVDPEMEGIAAMVQGPTSRKGIANQSAKIKELKGGKQSTKDLMENIIQRQSTLIDAALKNKAMLEVVNNLDGTDYMQAIDSPDIAALSQAELSKIGRVRVMHNGKAKAYAVSDPALLRGLLQINDAGSKSLFNRMARSAKRFLTAGITLSPDFIIKNFVRDATHAWMINKDDFKFGADSIKGIKKAFKEDELYRDLIFSGAAFQGGYVHGADPEAAAQQIRRTLAAKGLGQGQIDSYVDSLVTKGSQLFEMYRTASDKFENANRLSTFEAALTKGKSKRQAAFEAKDLMDYSLKGNFALIGTMIDMLPFFNARLQGMSKLVRAARAGDGDRVLKVLSANLAMKGMKVAAFSLALAALNDDDERYKELPDWDKDGNWHFWLGDDHFRIPKPFELGILFGTMPERLFNYGTGNQPASDLGKSVAHALFNTLALNPIPQIALPMVEVMTNRSFFKGSAIEGMADENKQAEDRYNAYTSDVAKLIGEAFGTSPKKIDHVIKGYTGTLGGYVLGIADGVARQIMGVESADTPISRYPVIKAFYQSDTPKTATKYQDEFYDALETATQAYGSYKRAVEEGDVVRQQELKEDEAKSLSSRVHLNRVQRQLSQLSKQAEMVNNNQALSGAQKRDRLDEITRKKNALYQGAYVRFKLGEW